MFSGNIALFSDCTVIDNVLTVGFLHCNVAAARAVGVVTIAQEVEVMDPIWPLCDDEITVIVAGHPIRTIMSPCNGVLALNFG